MNSGVTYTIAELETESGVRRRTIHHWVAVGLLPSPSGGGSSSTYGEEHLLRLRLITLLRMAGLTIAHIRDALRGTTTGEMVDLLAQAENGSVVELQELAESLKLGVKVQDSKEMVASQDTITGQAHPVMNTFSADLKGRPPEKELSFMVEDMSIDGRKAHPEPEDEIRAMDSAPQALQRRGKAVEWSESLPPDSHETWQRIRVDDGVELTYRDDTISLSKRKLNELIFMIRKLLQQD